MGLSPEPQGPPVRTGGPAFSSAFGTRSSPVIGVGGSPWTTSTGNYGRLSQGPVASPQLGNWMMNLNDSGAWVKQDLSTTVNVGDALSVTF
jgi:hypothetical protein